MRGMLCYAAGPEHVSRAHFIAEAFMKSRTDWQQPESLHLYLFANLWTGLLLYAAVAALVR